MLRSARVVGIALVCAMVALAAASPLGAQKPPGSEDSSVNQYTEIVPGAGGPTAPGVGKNKKIPLPKAAADALREAPPQVAAPLEEVATSSTYGAPAIVPPLEPDDAVSPLPPREPDVVPDDTPLDATLRSTVAAIGSADDGRLLGLLVALGLTTLGAVALAITRTRARARI